MSTENTFLEKVRIRNYLSLRDVELPLKPLTVLVGPNASGKSNALEALELLRKMMKAEEPPPANFIKNRLWAGGAESMSFQLEAGINKKKSFYTVELKPEEGNRIFKEKLVIDEVDVINVENGKGKVRDEDGTNETDYQSRKPALTSAGDYGIKPATQALNKFIRNWKFYDFDPEMISSENIELLAGRATGESQPKVLNERGESLRYVLSDWYGNANENFQDVNRDFEIYSKFRINAPRNGDGLSFFEGYSKPIPIDKISDGTLRLLAYLVLNYQPELPPLLAIEEPERNLHPGWFSIVGDILNQLSARTQVIITTHSSQLLDTFAPQSLQDNLGVLLLHNIRGTGTEVLIIDRARQDKKGLQNWIDEFGIGSAIFHSEMFQNIVQDSREV